MSTVGAFKQPTKTCLDRLFDTRYSMAHDDNFSISSTCGIFKILPKLAFTVIVSVSDDKIPNTGQVALRPVLQSLMLLKDLLVLRKLVAVRQLRKGSGDAL